MRKLILLAGLPGTGKSYYAKSIQDENCHIISSDETRFSITHDYRIILEDMNVVYDKMIDKTNELLATNDNITIVLDSTFLDDKRRNYFLDKIKGAEYIQLVMLKANIDTILRRNHKRPEEKWVPEDVILSMMERYKDPSLDNIYRYNFIKVVYVND